jgi:hypothetical protein
MDIKTVKQLTALSRTIPRACMLNSPIQATYFVRSSRANFLCWATVASAAGTKMAGYTHDVTKITVHFLECTVHTDK